MSPPQEDCVIVGRLQVKKSSLEVFNNHSIVILGLGPWALRRFMDHRIKIVKNMAYMEWGKNIKSALTINWVKNMIKSQIVKQEQKMKRMALVVFVYLSWFQCAQAATSALAESLLEYQAITSFIGTTPGFTVIGPSEFIVDIKRLTRQIDITGTVRYKICTRQVMGAAESKADEDQDSNGGRRRVNVYLATLTVVPNSGIGPNIVTVDSIVKVSGDHLLDGEHELVPEMKMK